MAQTSTVRFTKFSTPGPLLGLYKKQQNLVKADPNKASPLLFATDTAVEFLITDVGYPGKVHEASKDKTVTLVRSSRHNRLPRIQGLKDSIEIGAEYLAGKDPEPSFSITFRLLQSLLLIRIKMQKMQLASVHCATLGELCEGNSESFFRRNPYSNSKDATANCVLQVVLDDKDKKLWNVMDQATFEAIEVMAGEEKSKIEWWHEPKGNTDPSKVGWRKNRPGQDTIRMEGIVHEAGLLPMGEPGDRNACVDSNYKLKGVSNVYVTGACLFPTSGSWNPTLTMCGYAQDLAKKLTPHHNQQ
ncbi:GMC oxidoreductase [Rhizoctonia solani]|uniref:GMC oxidoreductase n=1 Tax=Rhizoctonia solani TaxID=456999 RepID=A0A8H7I5L6_9AGAM|nr:GMC oxidoreductase [Rhizoctonia solani]